jgi:hypothetical protein
MEQRFICPITGRVISIVIEDQFVVFTFIFKDHDQEFYDFLKEDWHLRFKEHMKYKSWFTQEMSDFITSNIQP